MKDLISEIARALVDRPEEVTVNEVEGGQTLILELKVAKQDMGKIIARQDGPGDPNHIERSIRKGKKTNRSRNPGMIGPAKNSG